MFGAQPGWISKKSPSSETRSDDTVHVVRLRRVIRDDGVECLITPIDGIRRRAERCVGQVVLRQVAEQSPGRGQRLGLVPRRKVGDAADGRVGNGAAERLGVDLFVGHGLHDVRAR